MNHECQYRRNKFATDKVKFQLKFDLKIFDLDN